MGEAELPTYFVRSAQKLESAERITHYNLHEKREIVTENWLPGRSDDRRHHGRRFLPQQPDRRYDPPRLRVTRHTVERSLGGLTGELRVESFFSAVHNFTVVPIHRAASKPIDSSTLAWLPVIGILSALLGISFYLPTGYALPSSGRGGCSGVGRHLLVTRLQA